MSKQEKVTLTEEQSRIVADIQQELKAERTVESPRGRTKTTKVEVEVEDQTETDKAAEEKFTKSIKG